MANPEDVACPPQLKAAEKEMLKLRPKHQNGDGNQNLVGFGLSGGGIRSATFCLGVFQALAKLGLLGEIDYISSVSGGGYFAGFYGRLFTRDEIESVADVEKILSPDEKVRRQLAGEKAWGREVFEWLRENGRYLSPKGGGDLLLDLAVTLRNLLTVQSIIAVTLMTIFLIAQAIRPGLDCLIPAANSATHLHIWWSPYVIVVGVLAVLWVLPLGWAYWMFGRPEPSEAERAGNFRRSALLALVPVLLAAFLLAGRFTAYWWLIVMGAGAFCLMTIVFWIAAWRVSAEKEETESKEESADERRTALPKQEEVLFRNTAARTWLSKMLSAALASAAALLAFGLIDSLGQTLYALHWSPDFHPLCSLAALYVALTAVAPFAKWAVSSLTPKDKSQRPPVSLSVLAGAGAAAIILPLLVALDGFSHAIAYNFMPPNDQAVQTWLNLGLLGFESGPRQWHSLLWSLAVAIGLSWIAGAGGKAGTAAWVFLNRTSLHALYTARLVRAYLGASNKSRLGPTGANVSDVVRGDDISQERYWPPRDQAYFGKGAPLHLVNATINETLGGRSQVEQRDRKGIGMAIGPAGISAGVRHHVVYGTADTKDPIFPAASEFRVFDYPGDKFAGQRLSLGNWVGVSGAAVTTGMGFRTSLGLSLLTGLFNVRLGYWWDSGVWPEWRKPKRTRSSFAAWLGTRISRILPLQSHLLDELLARFHGTARQRWYLSDGGNFENLGAYELIRRRLPLIVIVDAGADPDYEFEDVTNLVRKARLDFNAEVRFLDAEEIGRRWPLVDEVMKSYGSLDEIRRGRWAEEPTPYPKASRKPFFKSSNARRLSLKRVALAEVRYDGKGEEEKADSRLILIKPSLIGDEPADVLSYHRSHPSFPHESTAEQFFDEAQWESYRRLGQHIAEQIFRRPGDGGFTPSPKEVSR